MISLTTEKLEEHKDNQNLIQKVARQIQKDFHLYGEKIEFTGTKQTAYDELFVQIQPIIDRMLNLDSVRFFSLLYAIDIDELKVKSLLFGNDEVNTTTEITHLIMERELLKVLTRAYYSRLMRE